MKKRSGRTRTEARRARADIWTSTDDDAVRVLYATRTGTARLDWSQLPPRLRARSRHSIRMHATRLGLATPQGWSAREVATLQREWGVGRDTLLAKLPGRSWRAIVSKAETMGLSTWPGGWLALTTAARRGGVSPEVAEKVVAWADAEEKARRARGGKPYDADALHVPSRRHTASRRGRTASSVTWRLVEWDAFEAALLRWLTLETVEQAAARHRVCERWLMGRVIAAGLHPAQGRARRVVRLAPEVFDGLIARRQAA